MARSPHALRSWLPAAALLCMAGCEHKPDVVAQFEANSQAGSGVPTTPGNSTAGTPDAPSNMGSGGTFEVAGNNTRGDAGMPVGDAGPEDAGEDGGSGDSGGRPEPNCEPGSAYWTIQTIVESGCVLDAKYFALIAPFVQQPSAPIGESRGITLCDVIGAPPFYIDTKGRYVLCDDACNAARKWVEDKHNEVLRCMGLLDAGASSEP